MGVSKIFNILFRNLIPEFTTSNSKDHTPSSEATSSSSSQQILRVNINYRVHSSPLPVIIPSSFNPVDAFPSFVFKIHFNIILSLTLLSANLFLSGFPKEIMYALVFPYTCIMLRPFHSYDINRPIFFPFMYTILLLYEGQSNRPKHVLRIVQYKPTKCTFPKLLF